MSDKEHAWQVYGYTERALGRARGYNDREAIYWAALAAMLQLLRVMRAELAK